MTHSRTMDNRFNDSNKSQTSSVDVFFILHYDKTKRKPGERMFIPEKGEQRTVVGWGYAYDNHKMQYVTVSDINNYHTHSMSNKYCLP